MTGISRKRRPPKAVEAAALRICRELNGLDAGRILYWHEAHAIEKRLAIAPAEAAKAYEYGAAAQWLQGVADPVFSLHLLEADRKKVAKS